VFPRQYESRGHNVQTLSVVFVHGVVSYVVGTHKSTQVCTNVPPRQYESSGHCEQTRFDVLTHGVVSCVPGTHSGVHGLCSVSPVQ
jgi:hypothetical protein